MNKKRGQISTFIILGLVLLILLGLIYYLKSMSVEDDLSLTEESSLASASKSMETYVETCLLEIGLEAIEYIGLHGGYYDFTNVYATSGSDYNTAYYFFLDENIMPTKEIIEIEIAKYIDDNLFLCLQDFESFQNQGFTVEEDNPETVVVLNDEPIDSVSISLYFPLTIIKDSEQKQLDEFNVVVDDIVLKRMLDSASLLTVLQVDDPDNLCVSCMFEEAVKNDFTMEMTDINEDSIVFMIHENTTENNLTLIYANRYLVYTCDNPPEDADAYFYVDCIEEQKESLGYEFYIQEIPDMEAIVGEELYYNILFLGENVTFTDHTDLFDINSETGEFEFVPGEDDIGNYTIWIKAIDIFETEKYIDFRLSVVGNVGENE